LEHVALLSTLIEAHNRCRNSIY